jgi:hypothetical protein
MTKSLGPEKVSPEELARLTCNDCGVNVAEVGELFMIKDEIWKGQFGLAWNDNLCLGCIEARLGRELRFLDLMTISNYPWVGPPSERMVARLLSWGMKMEKPREPRKAKKATKAAAKAARKVRS